MKQIHGYKEQTDRDQKGREKEIMGTRGEGRDGKKGNMYKGPRDI